MKISYNWLKKYVNLDRSTAEIEEALTLIGFEVEGVVETGLSDMPEVVVGEILTSEPHPDADRLSVCSVKAAPDDPPRQIVCGASNYKVGDHVPVALPGSVLPGGFKIKASKLRGVQSDGMMCSASELGLGKDSAGIMILDPATRVGEKINEVFPDTDTIFDVEVTPNRPDCLSHVGIARELAAYFGLDLEYPEVKHSFEADDTPEAHRILEHVAIETEENCPHYTALRIAGVKIEPSPRWLQDAIQAVGWRPINNVVDITNYVMMELGQPLHAFDAAKIAGRRIVVRQAKEGEEITLLDEKKHTLSSRTMVIADAEKALAVAGVMGSASAEVDDTTVDVVLESAYFRPPSVRWTSKRLGVSTESSYRFERGVDPLNPKFAAERAADLILEVAGGHLAGQMLEAGAEPVIRDEIRLDPEFVRKRAGFDITDRRIAEILRSLELIIHEGEDHDGNTEWTVELPGFRSDLEAPIDLVEEVIRIHGTDKIPPATVQAVGIVGQDDPIAEYNGRAADYLQGQHFSECMNYTLRSEDELNTWFARGGTESFALANPLSSDQTHMRRSLLPGLLDVIRLNQSRKTGAAGFFECGRIFGERDGAAVEMNAVGFAILHDERARVWLTRAKPDFYTAKNLVRNLTLLAAFDFDLADIVPVEASAMWQDGHAAIAGSLDAGFVARMGLVNPFALRRWDIEGTVVAGMLAILPEALYGREMEPVRYRPFSQQPAAERDLALVVDAGELAGTVRARLRELTDEAMRGRSFQLEAVSVFDVYEGKGLPDDKKNLAFSLAFRAPDRTLTDEEVNDAFNSIQKAVSEKTGYTVRK